MSGETGYNGDKAGKKAMSWKFVKFVSKSDHLIMATKTANSIMFKESDVRAMGRAAAGVRG